MHQRQLWCHVAGDRYAARLCHCCGSCVAVTGSHNPPDYNGLKMVIGGTTLALGAIQDLKKYLDPLFSWLRLLQWGTIGASVLLLLAAVAALVYFLRRNQP